MSGPASANSRVPWPRITGTTSRVISSTRSCSSSHRTRVAAAVHLQLARPLGLQLADGGREVTGEDGRVRPAPVR